MPENNSAVEPVRTGDTFAVDKDGGFVDTITDATPEDNPGDKAPSTDVKEEGKEKKDSPDGKAENPDEEPGKKTEEAGDSEAETNPEEEAGKEQKKESRAQRRIRQILGDNKELREKVAALEQTRNAEVQAPQPKPKREDFDYLDDYEKALSDWTDIEAKRVTDEKLTEAQRKAEQERLKAAQQKHNEMVDEWTRKGAKKFKDFVEVAVKNEEATEYLDRQPVLIEQILKSEDSHELAYYLGKNIDDLFDMASMKPEDALVRLGEIKAERKQGRQEVKNTTDAPPPVRTLESDKATESGESKMTMDDFAKKWQKEQREKRG